MDALEEASQNVQGIAVTLIGISVLVLFVAVNIYMYLKLWKILQLLKKERLIYTNNLKTLELLEKELEKKKNDKDVFFCLFSDN